MARFLVFLEANWLWILLVGGMLLMHLGHRHGGHGGSGGHGGHGGRGSPRGAEAQINHQQDADGVDRHAAEHGCCPTL